MRSDRTPSPSPRRARTTSPKGSATPGVWKDVNLRVQAFPVRVQVAFAVRCLERVAEFGSALEAEAVERALCLGRRYASGLEVQVDPVRPCGENRYEFEAGNRVYTSAVWLLEAIGAKRSTITTTFLLGSIGSAIDASAAALRAKLSGMSTDRIQEQIHSELTALETMAWYSNWDESTRLDPDQLGPIWQTAALSA